MAKEMAEDLSSFSSRFAIRSVAAIDSKIVRILLPEIRNPAMSMIATSSRFERVVGAAAITRSCRTQPLRGPGVAIEVIEPCRRQGIGRRLLAELEAAAGQVFGAEALYAAARVDEDAAKMQGWQWLGFSPVDVVEEHVLSIEQFEPRLGPLIERLRTKRRIPVRAEIVPLYRANAAAVMQLHLDQMGGDRGELYRKLRGKGAGAFHPRYSRVLLIDGVVKGCVLAHRASKYAAQVDAVIVDPALRGGWANAWLKLEASRRALSLGIKEFKFTSFSHYG